MRSLVGGGGLGLFFLGFEGVGLGVVRRDFLDLEEGFLEVNISC